MNVLFIETCSVLVQFKWPPANIVWNTQKFYLKPELITVIVSSTKTCSFLHFGLDSLHFNIITVTIIFVQNSQEKKVRQWKLWEGLCVLNDVSTPLKTLNVRLLLSVYCHIFFITCQWTIVLCVSLFGNHNKISVLFPLNNGKIIQIILIELKMKPSCNPKWLQY